MVFLVSRMIIEIFLKDFPLIRVCWVNVMHGIFVHAEQTAVELHSLGLWFIMCFSVCPIRSVAQFVQ